MTEGKKRKTKQTADEWDAEIGRKMRQRRRQLKMSQKALGKKIGVSYQQVQKYEIGRSRISVGLLMRLAEYMEISPSYFFGCLWREDVGDYTDRYVMALDEALIGAKGANDNLGEAVRTMTECRKDIMASRPRRRHRRDFLDGDGDGDLV